MAVKKLNVKGKDGYILVFILLVIISIGFISYSIILAEGRRVALNILIRTYELKIDGDIALYYSQIEVDPSYIYLMENRVRYLIRFIEENYDLDGLSGDIKYLYGNITSSFKEIDKLYTGWEKLVRLARVGAELAYVLGYLDGLSNNVSLEHVVGVNITYLAGRVDDLYEAYMDKAMSSNVSINIDTLFTSRSFLYNLLVERALYFSETLLRQATDIIKVNRPREIKLAYIYKNLENVRGKLVKVDALLDSGQALVSTISLKSVFNHFNNLLKIEFSSIRVSSGAISNLTLIESKNYVERALKLYDKGYYAFAVLDILTSYILTKSIEQLNYIPDPWIKVEYVAHQDLFTLKSYIKETILGLVENYGDEVLILRWLMEYGLNDVFFGDDVLKRVIDFEVVYNYRSLTYCYSFYSRALIYFNNLEKLLSIYITS